MFLPNRWNITSQTPITRLSVFVFCTLPFSFITCHVFRSDSVLIYSVTDVRKCARVHVHLSMCL